MSSQPPSTPTSNSNNTNRPHPHPEQQQQHQQQHMRVALSHEDYDWMGMLDTLDAEHPTYDHQPANSTTQVTYHHHQDAYSSTVGSSGSSGGVTGVAGVAGVAANNHTAGSATATAMAMAAQQQQQQQQQLMDSSATSSASGGGGITGHHQMDVAATVAAAHAAAAAVTTGGGGTTADPIVAGMAAAASAGNGDQSPKDSPGQPPPIPSLPPLHASALGGEGDKKLSAGGNSLACKSPREPIICDSNHGSNNSNNNNNNNNNGGESDCPDSKKQSRIERKRSREKQRRLDTNSQFTALADIVREIETTDFVEEAQYNLTKQYGVSGGMGGGGVGSGGMAGMLSASEDGKSENASASAGGEGMDSNKKLKSNHPNDSSTSDPLMASALVVATAACGIATTMPAFNPSNRVDLIARTIAQLTQFRIIRRRRNEEVRDSRRVNCELRKECEELRRMVAHYKAVGMSGGGGMQKPQEKVMMMVPMMVPQDAVNQIATGYPASHQYASTASASNAHFAAPWMQAATAMAHPSATMALGGGVMHHHLHPQHQQLQQQHHHAASAQGNGTTSNSAPSPSVGGQQQQQPAPAPGIMMAMPHNLAAQQQQMGQQMQPAFAGMPPPAPQNGAPQQQQQQQQPPGRGSASPGGQQMQPQGTQGQAPSAAPSFAQNNMQIMQPMVATNANAAPVPMTMYPQVTTAGGMPSFVMHHPYGAPPNPLLNQGESSSSANAPVDANNVQQQPQVSSQQLGVVVDGGQQQQQHPIVAGPSSEKPTAGHQAGGGNLAHCA